MLGDLLFGFLDSKGTFPVASRSQNENRVGDRDSIDHYSLFADLTKNRIGAETVDLLDKLLICNPRERMTASQALDHDYFWTDPLPADPKRCAFPYVVLSRDRNSLSCAGYLTIIAASITL